MTSNFETRSLSGSLCYPLGLNLGFMYAFRFLVYILFYYNLNGMCITLLANSTWRICDKSLRQRCINFKRYKKDTRSIKWKKIRDEIDYTSILTSWIDLQFSSLLISLKRYSSFEIFLCYSLRLWCFYVVHSLGLFFLIFDFVVTIRNKISFMNKIIEDIFYIRLYALNHHY